MTHSGELRSGKGSHDENFPVASSLMGTGGDEPEGLRLRTVLNERGLSPRHAQDLLSAFRQDATKLRYANWDELIDYCSRSAMPVGRFVLDVHGEARDTWPSSDA